MSETEELLLRILQALNRIDGKLGALDDLVNITKLSQQESMERTKLNLLQKSPLRKAVYSLCDGSHSVSEIAKELNKSLSTVSQAMSQLQEANLIRETRRGKQKFYRRVF